MPIYIERGNYFTSAEAAEYLGTGAAHIVRLLARGQLTGFRIGKAGYLIPAADVIARKKNPPSVGRPKSNPSR